jgi:hypothetical protein
MPDVSKINAVAIGDVSKIDGIAKADISKYGGGAVPSGTEQATRWFITSTSGKVFESDSATFASGSVSEMVDLGGQVNTSLAIGEDNSGNKRWCLYAGASGTDIRYGNNSGSLDASGQWTTVSWPQNHIARSNGGPAIAWGNGNWFTVGSKRTVGGGIYSPMMSSSDGAANWVEVAPAEFTVNSNAHAIAYKDTDFWVMGYGDGSFFTASNAVDWGDTGASAATQINAIVYDGTSRWASVGQGGKVYYSDDDFASITQGSYPWTSNVFGLCYAAGSINKWIAVGATGRIAHSPDGINFTASTVPAVLGSTNLQAIATDNTTLVAVGNSNMILTSSDGTNWVRVSSSASDGYLLYAVACDVVGAGMR